MFLLNFTCLYLIRSSYPDPFYELLHYNCHMTTLLVETSMKSVLSCLLVLFVSLRAIILLGLVIINVSCLTCELFYVASVIESSVCTFSIVNVVI